MKKLSITLLLLTMSNVVFADIGPLTLNLQKYFAETEQCYFKYYDYSISKMMNSFSNKNKTLKPYSVIELTKDDKFEAHRTTQIANKTEKENAGGWYLIDYEKGYYYSLKIHLKTGIRKDIRSCEYGEKIIATLDSLPTALALTLPKKMLTSNLRGRINFIKLDGCYDVNLDGKTYQCESYSSSSNANYMKGLLPFSDSKGYSEQYKLFYKNGVLVGFEEQDVRCGMATINNVACNDLKTIPSGYIIYADNSKTLDGLIQKQKVLEKH